MSVPDKFTAKFANEPDLLSLNTGCGGHYNEDLTFLRSDNCGAAGNMNSKNLTQLARLHCNATAVLFSKADLFPD